MVLLFNHSIADLTWAHIQTSQNGTKNVKLSLDFKRMKMEQSVLETTWKSSWLNNVVLSVPQTCKSFIYIVWNTVN